MKKKKEECQNTLPFIYCFIWSWSFIIYLMISIWWHSLILIFFVLSILTLVPSFLPSSFFESNINLSSSSFSPHYTYIRATTTRCSILPLCSSSVIYSVRKDVNNSSIVAISDLVHKDEQQLYIYTTKYHKLIFNQI